VAREGLHSNRHQANSTAAPLASPTCGNGSSPALAAAERTPCGQRGNAATRHQGTGRPGRDTTSGNGGPGDPRRYTTVECFASATGETVKDTAHAKAIVAEMSDALSKMSKLGASK
jgi:hypothetical protein